MTDEHSPQRDLEWYRTRWAELTDLLSVSDPEGVVDKVQRLQERVETLAQQQEALAEAVGKEDPEQARQMVENMTDQLNELYAERDRRGEPRFEQTETEGGG